MGKKKKKLSDAQRKAREKKKLSPAQKRAKKKAQARPQPMDQARNGYVP